VLNSGKNNHVNIFFIFLIVHLFMSDSIIFAQDHTGNSEIIVDLTKTPIGSVTASLLGVNNPMNDLPLRTQYNPVTGEFNQEFYNKVKSLGIKCFRFPGGNNSGSYNWKNGIGFQEDRPSGYNGSSGAYAPDYYIFGFMEFMDFIEKFGMCEPIICINFGTGTAIEAAAWVEFANSEPGSDPNGDGIDQAQIRADLGHPEPYNIRLWEIGNELGGQYKHMFSWHFGQMQTGGENYVKTVHNYIFGGSQWQYYEMETRKNGQRVVQMNDWTLTASKSNGSKNQIFYVKYPPVESDSLYLGVWRDSLTVEQWQEISDFEGQTGEAKVYTLDNQTGRIDFGDGSQGAIPPAGSEIRVIYKSTSKDGLIDFYEKMNAVDDDISIGVPFHDEIFYQKISNADFSELHFDFIVDHRYEPGRCEQLEKEHWQIMWTACYQETLMYKHRDTLDQWFNEKKKIGIWITEYNLVYHIHGRENSTNNPWYQGEQLDFFGRSLDNGLYIAGALMSYLRASQKVGLEVLNIHSLVPDSDAAIAGWPLTSLMGPDPHRYVNPSGYVYNFFSRSFDYRIIRPVLNNIPQYRFKPIEEREKSLKSTASQTDSVKIFYLDALITCSEKSDTLYLFVLNRASNIPEAGEKYHDITAEVIFQDCSHLSHITFFELNAENLWMINSNTFPENVFFSQMLEQPFTTSFSYTFPAHSLTVIMAVGESSVLNEDRITPASEMFILHQNYPNPFNTLTKIMYEITSFTHVNISVFDIEGRLVRTLVDEKKQRGSYSVNWDANNLSSGLYFYRLNTDTYSKICKALVLK